MSDILNLTIKILPSGDEIEVELSAYTTARELLEELAENNIISRTDANGNPVSHQLTRERTNRPIGDKTLLDHQVEKGETLYCVPELIHGGSGRIDLPRSEKKDHINIVIRIMPQGGEVEVELPLAATGAEIIRELMFSDVIPERDSEGNPIVYQLISSFSSQVIHDQDTLKSVGVQNGEILYCVPKLVAGGCAGHLIYQLPSVLKIGEKATGQVRISREGLQELILREGLDPDAKFNRIEINDVMEVTLEENALHELLKIKPLNRAEQIISDDSYTEWNFDLYTATEKPGFTALLLRVTMVEMLEGYGERKKDVFLLNHEVEIAHGQPQSNREFVHDFRQIYEWTEPFRQEIYDFIRDNDTGRALSKLANFYQQYDQNVFHSVLLLQAQWNEGRNQHLTNLITTNDWYTVQARVNMGILELVRDIETHVTDRAWTGAGNGALLEGMIGSVADVRDGRSL